MKIRVTSRNGQVRYQVLRHLGFAWLVEGEFRTRREAKKFIEERGDRK